MQMEFVMFFVVLAAGLTIYLILRGFREKEKPPFLPLIGAFAVILWFIASASSVVVDVPYQKVVENTEDNSMTIVETGVQKVNNVGVPAFCWAMGFGTLALTFLLYMDRIKDWLFKRRRRGYY